MLSTHASGQLVVHYNVIKYTACRNGKCASSKQVACVKVCAGSSIAKQIGCSSSYCKKPYGPQIVKEIAMMA